MASKAPAGVKTMTMHLGTSMGLPLPVTADNACDHVRVLVSLAKLPDGMTIEFVDDLYGYRVIVTAPDDRLVDLELHCKGFDSARRSFICKGLMACDDLLMVVTFAVSPSGSADVVSCEDIGMRLRPEPVSVVLNRLR